MAVAENFLGVPQVGSAIVSVANQKRDGTGTTVQGFSGFSGTGSYLTSVKVLAMQAVSAGMIRGFIFDGGSAYPLLQIPVVETACDASTPAFSAELKLDQMIPSQAVVKFSTERGESFSIISSGQNF